MFFNFSDFPESEMTIDSPWGLKIETEINNLSLVMDMRLQTCGVGLSPGLADRFRKLKALFQDKERVIESLKKARMKKGGYRHVRSMINRWWNTLQSF